MKLINKINGLTLAASAYLSTTLPAFAQGSVTLCPNDPSSNDFSVLCDQAPDFNLIVKGAIQILLIAAVVIALVFLIWGGIKWILSGGDKAKVESARNTVIGAIIGLIIAFAAFFVLNIVGGLFGLGDLTQLTLPRFTQ